MMKKISILVAALVVSGSLSAMSELDTVAVIQAVELEKLVEQAVEAGLVTKEEAQALATNNKGLVTSKKKYLIAALIAVAAVGAVALTYHICSKQAVTVAEKEQAASDVASQVENPVMSVVIEDVQAEMPAPKHRYNLRNRK